MSSLPISSFKVLLTAIALAYLGLAAFALLFANKMIFPAPPSSYAPSAKYQQLPIGPAGSAITVHFMPNPTARYLVFYQHGNGEDLGSIEERLQELHAMGHAVLAWDYPNYGTSEGSPSEQAVFAIADQLWQLIPQRFGFSHDRVILYGRSVGGGPAVWLGAKHKAAGLILEGTFTSTFRVLTRIRLLPWDVFDNLSRIDRLQCPVLFLHGTSDHVVPFSHGEQLLAAASKPKSFTWFDDGGHNDLIERFPDIYRSSIRAFINELTPTIPSHE